MKNNHYWEVLAQIFTTIVALIVVFNVIYGDRMDRMNNRLTRLEDNYPRVVEAVKRIERGFERLLDTLELKPTNKD